MYIPGKSDKEGLPGEIFTEMLEFVEQKGCDVNLRFFDRKLVIDWNFELHNL